MKIFLKLLTISLLIHLGTLKATTAQHHSNTLNEPENTGMLEIVATDFAFEAPDVIPSGWHTIEFTNTGSEPHMLLFHRLPEGVTFQDFAIDVWGPLDEVWQETREQENEFIQLGGIGLPNWFNAPEQWMGGGGILSGGHSTVLTLYLEPGIYTMECYVKTVDGEFHAMEGMLRELIVTDLRLEKSPPEADIKITLTNTAMSMEGDITAGHNLFEVHLAEGRNHNVHVVRLDVNSDINEVLDWIDWSKLEGLWPPEPVEFVGGLHLLSEGGTGYFTLDLEPGRYLFLSEMTAADGVMKEVLVPPAEAQEANPEDVSSIDGIINAYYEVVSGPVGEPADAERDRSLHHPDAWIAIAGKDDDGQSMVEVMTLDEFHGDNEPREEGFWEWETDRTVSRSGNMIHVWSSYAIARTEGGEPYETGVNSITLFHDGTRYWIMGWMYDEAVK